MPFILAILVLVASMTGGTPSVADLVEALRAEREEYLDHFRIHGEHQPDRARALEEQLRTLAEKTEGPPKASALYELATVQRITNQFPEAIDTYREAAEAAAEFDLDDVAFDAWIGIARAHAYGTRDHGAAARAFSRAEATAGHSPTPKQAYDMADYASQLQANRGELEAALVSALSATRLARNDPELFYAQMDVAGVLHNLAESCDYRKLIDAGTDSDEGDSWGACRRAVAAAKAYYEDARQTAERLGWSFLVSEMEGFIGRLDARLFLINQKTSFEKLGTAATFAAQDIGDVLVNENFESGASTLQGLSPLGQAISEVVPSEETDDPRSLYLLGIRADLEQDPEAALGYFEKAVTLLEQERSSLFDLRHRGTVVENRPELARDLGLRLLSRGQYDEAFRAFESMRARGLADLAAAYATVELSDDEREWLARLVQAESQESAALTDLVETAIAGVEYSRSAGMLEHLEQMRARRRELLTRKSFGETTRRLASVAREPMTLAEFQARVRDSGIPVLLYWVTHTNVVVWVVSPQGMDVKTVFLPEVAVTEKVSRLVRSIRTVDQAFDRTAARELHTYLIRPFVDLLQGRQILIVPQGPLVTLPFEALIDTRTDDFLAERTAVSYAPSATFAARALGVASPATEAVTVVFDDDLERLTGEVSRMSEDRRIDVTRTPSGNLSPRAMLQLLGQDAAVHVLLHGMFDQRAPLQSHLRLNNPQLSREDDEITAAELLAAEWRDTQLAVFSACEGAMMNRRISNEVYGLSWAPLAGGAANVVLSRWRVQSDSNADWMARFYGSLASPESSPALAAAEAMRGMISSGREDPFYWAGPQVFGR